MPTYKLTYFNITGLGEPIRFLLAYGGVEYEDNRVNFEDWPGQLKAKMPMDQMPILEIDGKIYHQTRAISRYLAKKFGLYGANELEDIHIDASIDDIEDYRLFTSRFFREEDPIYKEKLKALALDKAPFYLGKFEERVKNNKGYFVNGKLTWADIHFTTIIEMLSNFNQQDLVKDYPNLKKLTETVRGNPKIKAYLDKRPKTNF